MVLTPKSAPPKEVPPIALVTPASVFAELEAPPKPPVPPVTVVPPKPVPPSAPVTLDEFVDAELVDAVPGSGPPEVLWADPCTALSALPSSGAPAAPPSPPDTGGGDVSSLGGRSALGLQASAPTAHKACQMGARCARRGFSVAGFSCMGSSMVGSSCVFVSVGPSTCHAKDDESANRDDPPRRVAFRLHTVRAGRWQMNGSKRDHVSGTYEAR